MVYCVIILQVLADHDIIQKTESALRALLSDIALTDGATLGKLLTFLGFLRNVELQPLAKEKNKPS